MHTVLRKILAYCCALSMLFSAVPLQAAMLGADAGLQAEAVATDAAAERARIDAFLAREEVREQLTQLGVAPEDVEGRLAALSDAEVRTLAARIDQDPAGAGVLGVIGVVFVVLLILELVGVTDVFTQVGPAQ